MNTFNDVLRRWLSQDIARFNAGTAADRLFHERQDRQSVEAYLTHQLHPQATRTPAPRAADGSGRPRTEAPAATT